MCVFVGRYAAVYLSLVSSTNTTAYINVDDSSGARSIANLVATCASLQDAGCSSAQLTVNPTASDPGWLSYTGLKPGSAYQITVDESTFDGNPNTLLGRTITFCTGMLVVDDNVM